MSNELNIAAILKDKPQNTRLWSPIFGDVYLKDVTDVNNNMIRITHHGVDNIFMNNGKVWADGDVCLFPSRRMDDWQKFAWKKGDILVSNDNDSHIIFEGFSKDDYTTFEGKHWTCVSIKRYISYLDAQNTQDYHIEDDKDAAQTYINTIEERFCGKLNLETLEIEKQPEFKEGDIVCISGMGYLAYGIVKSIDNSSKKLEYYVLNDMSTLKFEDWLSFEDKHIQPITETQQIILFDALAKKNKAWDAEKKQIENLKPKIELKPFDKVLSRRCSEDYWVLNFYSHKTDYYHICIDRSSNLYCIPYNEETAHLLGTTDDWEGGEQ